MGLDFYLARMVGVDIVVTDISRPAKMLSPMRLTALIVAVFPLIGAVAADTGVIPTPVDVTVGDGSFHLASSTKIVCAETNDVPCATVADILGRWLRVSPGIAVSQAKAASGPAIVFRRSDVLPKEAYRLFVTPSGIEILAAGNAGFLNAAATLFQLATSSTSRADEVDVPAVFIADAPRFSWRGLLLDSVRHYQSPETIKKFLDVMAWHKLNVLQWHLTDDQGWRIEVKKYPRLTKIGAFRRNAREGRYGGYYTQDQIRDIVAYAKARNITIVPEIEMPGHALAAIVAYPSLGSVKHPPKQVSGDWGVFPYLYNVDDRTFSFLQDVLTEVMALFPSAYIHIGGDEAPKDQWNASPRVQKRMRVLGVNNTKALQGHFTTRIGRFLEAHGRRLIGWDEILEGLPPAGAAVMSWRSVESATEAADKGHDVVLAPAPTLYLDYCQAARDGEPTCRGPAVSLHDVYTFSLEPKGTLEKHLLGVQANLWTEHVPSSGNVFYAAWPRAAALAELGWSKSRNWDDFVKRLPAEFDRYRAYSIDGSRSVFAVDLKADPTADGARVTLANQAGVGMRYAVGTSLTEASPTYTGPFEVTLPRTVTAAPFVDGRQVANATTLHLDGSSILRRSSWTMDQCTDDLPLAQKSASGAVVMVNVMHPCWIYRRADLSVLRGFDVAVAALPFNFQLMHDVKKIPLEPNAAPGGELQVHADRCDGALLATIKLSKASTTLHIELPVQAGVHDLCFSFARRKVDPVWAVEWVQPLLKE